MGFEIQRPLPFSRDEYERDFESAESRSEYRRFLAQATAVLELDGDRSDPETAYLNAGLVMLEQSDAIIAVWDGCKPAGRGGTRPFAAGVKRPFTQLAPPFNRRRPETL